MSWQRCDSVHFAGRPGHTARLAQEFAPRRRHGFDVAQVVGESASPSARGEEETTFFQVSGKLLTAAQKHRLAASYRRDYARLLNTSAEP